MRTFCLSTALLIFSAGAALAGVSPYPASYHSRGTDYYENLRTAKLVWLKTNAASVASDLDAARARLATQTGDAKTAAQASIDRLGKQASQIGTEIGVIRGPRDTRQENLLKRNVEAWIGAARRNGNGAEAIRLLHDLEGTGL